MKLLDFIATLLVIIGALNWGLIGIMDLNLVNTIFADMAMVSRIIYILVGLSGLWMIFSSIRRMKG